jgi:hypothetical protein
VPQGVEQPPQEQAHGDAADAREHLHDAELARGRRGLRRRRLRDRLGPVAEIAQEPAREVPAAQQRRAADPLHRDEIRPDRRMREYDLVGLAHERDVARQPPLLDVAQVRHVVGALAAEPVAVGPHAERGVVEQDVGLGAEHDRDVDLDVRSGRGAAAGLDRRDALDQARDVHPLQRVGLEREDAAVDGAVETQEQVGETAPARAGGGGEHDQRELGALDLAQPCQDVALPACHPAAVERHADSDGTLGAHSGHSPTSGATACAAPLRSAGERASLRAPRTSSDRQQ